MLKDQVYWDIDVQEQSARSPFALRFHEILAALAAGTASWFGIKAYLWSIPYPAPLYSYGGKLPPEYVQARQGVFDANSLALSVLIGVSVVFLMRGLLGQRVRYFSKRSNLATAIPMLLFLFSNISLATNAYFSVLYCLVGFVLLPVGIVIAILGLADATKSQTRQDEKRWGWLFSLGWNLLFFAASSSYFFDWFNVFGG